MEAIIKTNDRTIFDSLLQFLKSLNISVETKDIHSISDKTNKQNKRFSALQLKTKGVKFNREEANER